MSFKNMKISKRLYLLVVVLVVVSILVGIFGAAGMNSRNEALLSLYKDRLEPVEDLSRIRFLFNDNVIQLLNLSLQHDPKDPASRYHTDHTVQRHIDTVKSNIENITKLWEKYQQTHMTEEEKVAAERFIAVRTKFVREGLLENLKLLENKDYLAAKQFIPLKLMPLFNEVKAAHEELIQVQNKEARKLYESSVEDFKNLMGFLVALIIGGIVVGFGASILTVRSIVNPINQVIEIFRKISQGKLDNEITIDSNDEAGQLLTALKETQATLKANLEESLRLTVALDNVSTNIMMADTDFKIIYMNKSIVQMFERATVDIRKDIGMFDVRQIVGDSMDRYHKNPSLQRQILSTQTSTHKATIQIGGRTFNLTANPVLDKNGNRLGSVVEWVDRTDELRIEKEIENVVAHAVKGDFKQRIPTEGKSGFLLNLSNGMNQLLETLDIGLTEVVRVLGSLAAGNLTKKILNEYEGTFGELKEYSNNTVDKLAQVIDDVRKNADALVMAAEQLNQTAQAMSQSSTQQAASVEGTSSSLEQMTASISQNAENAKTTEQIAVKSANEAMEGGQAVTETVSAMKKIAEKISIIEEIAYQTNLLALNAAIEAARAGEHGKGFAVVASEVRKLAERSQVAAQEIGELATNSVKIAEKAGQLLEVIVPNIRKTADLVQEISFASSQQNSGVSQINSAVRQLDQVAQQNASASEELAATAEEMNGQAENLLQLMAFFTLPSDSSAGENVKRTKNKKAAEGYSYKANPTIKEEHFEKF